MLKSIRDLHLIFKTIIILNICISIFDVGVAFMSSWLKTRVISNVL